MTEKHSLTSKEVNKLLYSDHLKSNDFFWLYKLLDQNTSLDYSKIPENKQEIFLNVINDLLNNCSNEWVQSKGPNGQTEEDMGLDEKNWKTCSLCGTPNRYIFYIENTLNKCKLNVGSNCISEFGSIASNAKKSKAIMQKNAIKLKNLQMLLEEIPNVRTIVEKWDDFMAKLPLVLSKKETECYQNIGLLANRTYEEILSKGLEKKRISQLNNLIKSGKFEKNKILEKIETLKKNDFVLTNNQVNWIRSHQPDSIAKILDEIKNSNDSLISLNCASLIAEETFLTSFARKYNFVVKQSNETIENLYYEWRRNGIPSASEIKFEYELPKISNISTGSFFLQFTSIPNVQFILSSKKFISILGFLVFPSSKVALDASDVLKVITETRLANNNTSYENFFAQIEYIANKDERGERFNFYKVNIERDYVDFRVFLSSTIDEDNVVTYHYSYKRYPLQSFFKNVKGVLLKKNKDFILNFLEKNQTKTFTEKQYKQEEREEIDLDRMNS
ncbi:hypothetical protein ACRW9N_12140 [Listeria aquatica]|uniref:hypothetical protein n=1 Tax=Listeria aquatica TaxID=1494960 RepID=UPI003EF0B089